MRLVNRLLAAVLALVLAVAAGVLVVEVVAHLIGRGPVVLDGSRIGRWADTTTWSAPAVLAGGIAAMVVGVVLLIAECAPTRPVRFAAAPGADGVDAGYTRRGVAGVVRSAAEGVDGVASASVSVGRRAVRVSATAVASTPDVGKTLDGPVSAAVNERVDALRLAERPRVSVTTRAGRS